MTYVANAARRREERNFVLIAIRDRTGGSCNSSGMTKGGIVGGGDSSLGIGSSFGGGDWTTGIGSGFGDWTVGIDVEDGEVDNVAADEGIGPIKIF